MARSIRIPITDSSQVGEARRAAADLARTLQFEETQIAKLSIAVSEAANNLIKHACDGQVLLRPLLEPGCPGIEVLTLDRGPGMADVSRCLQDGYSTAGSPGTGMGAMMRLSRFFDVFSSTETGTALVFQLYAKPEFQPNSPFDIGAVCVPIAGETACGDDWEIITQNGRTRIAVADGLGHGPQAAQAADEALSVFKAHPHASPADLLQRMHGPLKATRGAAVAVAEIRDIEATLGFAGVGNISGVLLGEGGSRSLVSHNGTLGYELHRFQEFQYPWPPHGVIILHSDGLMSRWNIDLYPGLRRRHPSLIAGVLYRDFQRGRDDVTVVAARKRE